MWCDKMKFHVFYVLSVCLIRAQFSTHVGSIVKQIGQNAQAKIKVNRTVNKKIVFETKEREFTFCYPFDTIL